MVNSWYIYLDAEKKQSNKRWGVKGKWYNVINCIYLTANRFNNDND